MIRGLKVPVRVGAGAGAVTLRGAEESDLDAIMGLLTNDPVSDAHRFSERLGFAASHVGFTFRVEDGDDASPSGS